MDTKILSKLKKLSRLSQSSNENEAAVAAEMLAELLIKHELDAACLADDVDEQKDEPLVEEGVFEKAPKNKVWWKNHIAAGLARSVGAQVYYIGGQVTLFGTSSQVQKVRYMFQAISNEVERLAQEGWDDIQNSGELVGYSARKWKGDFRLGASEVLKSRLNRVRERVLKAASAPQQETALAVIRQDELIEQRFEAHTKGWNFQTVRQAPRYVCDGYSAGRTAGGSVDISSQGKRLSAGNGRLNAKG